METAFDPKTHSYLIDGKPATGVTTIISVLAKPALIGWAAKEAVKVFERIFSDPVLLNELLTPPNEEKLKAALEEAKNAHTRKKEAAGTHGTNAHSLVEQWILAEIKRYSQEQVA